MELVSMKKPVKKKKKARDKMMEYGEIGGESIYPYGLEINIQNDDGCSQLDNLGVDITKCNVGDIFSVVGRLEVKSLRQSDRRGYKGKREKEDSMSFQITDMALVKESKK